MDPIIISIDSNETIDYNDYSVKIVVVGDSGVGKSNILSRFCQNEFSHDTKTTVGVELSMKTYKIDNKIVKVNLWDTAGQERYKSITAAYYKGAKGALIVYDMTRRESFNSVDKWYQEVRDYGDKSMSVMLVGNKCDLTHLRSIENHELLDKSKKLGITHLSNKKEFLVWKHQPLTQQI